MSYFAFHRSIFESSLFRSGLTRLLVFQWLLAHCDEEGTVIARPWAIARDLAPADRERFTEEAVREALAYLAAPDADSRSIEAEGRRIVPVEGAGHTWRVVNYGFYNREWAAERRRVKEREKKRRQRAKVEECPSPVPYLSPTCPDLSRPKHKTDSESDSETHTEAERVSASLSPEKPERKGRRAKTSIDALGFESLPGEWLAAAERLGVSGATAQREFEKFGDHFRSEGKLRADWLATWRNWLRRLKDFSPPSKPADSFRPTSAKPSADAERILAHKLTEARARQAQAVTR